MNGMPLLFFTILSAFSMNLVLQCALGIKGVVESKNINSVSNLIKLGIIFFAVILLWTLFSKIISYALSGFCLYVLLFPVSYIVYDGLEYLVFQKIFKKDADAECSVSFPNGITAVSVFICMSVAGGLAETIFLSFGFVLGIYLVFIIVGEIRRRAFLENVPLFLKGKPLILVSMGMLSLVFSVGSLLLFSAV